MIEYDELQLRISPVSADAFQVYAVGPDGQQASETFTVPIGETELDNFVLRVGQQRKRTRAFGSRHVEEAKRLGERLHESLVHGAVRDVYIEARTHAQARDRGLRITLHLSDSPRLMQIPWEYLYDRPRFLASSIYTPIVRSLGLKTVIPPRKITPPLRILGVVSRPAGVVDLDVEAERRNLSRAIEPLAASGIVELVWLTRATLSELARRIDHPDEIHVLHFIGHGGYDSRSETGLLVFEDERGEVEEVTGEDLGSLLQDERSLRLAVLNACEGARTSHVDPFSGVASSLVDSGLPAVVAMQFEITDDAAVVFAQRMYEALGRGFAVDAAVAQARRAIFAANKDDVEFGTPVVFARAGYTQLFRIDAPTEPSIAQMTTRGEEPIAQAAPAVSEPMHRGVAPSMPGGPSGEAIIAPDHRPSRPEDQSANPVATEHASTKNERLVKHVRDRKRQELIEAMTARGFVLHDRSHTAWYRNGLDDRRIVLTKTGFRYEWRNRGVTGRPWQLVWSTDYRNYEAALSWLDAGGPGTFPAGARPG